MPSATGKQILRVYADADFHRRAAREVDTRLHDDEIAKVDGFTKVDPVDGRGHDAVSAVPKRRDGGTLVHNR